MTGSNLEQLYEEFLAAPFPRCGGSVGVFASYDDDIAGYASRAMKGEKIEAAMLPEPDDETTAFWERIRASDSCSGDETEFLRYFDLLERVRRAISDDPVDLHVPLLDEGTDVWVIAKGQRVGPRTYLVTSFELDLAAGDAKTAFDVGTTVYVNGGPAASTDDGVVVGTTPRVAVRQAS